jgi:DNA-binding response OmpR family regulator
LDQPISATIVLAAFVTPSYAAIAVANKERPSLIILDLGLPAGDGYAVLERLQSNDALSDIPVIVLTARDSQSSEKRSLAAGAAAFFQKPADNNELMELIRIRLQSPNPPNPMPS